MCCHLLLKFSTTYVVSSKRSNSADVRARYAKKEGTRTDPRRSSLAGFLPSNRHLLTFFKINSKIFTSIRFRSLGPLLPSTLSLLRTCLRLLRLILRPLTSLICLGGLLPIRWPWGQIVICGNWILRAYFFIDIVKIFCFWTIHIKPRKKMRICPFFSCRLHYLFRQIVLIKRIKLQLTIEDGTLESWFNCKKIIR